VTGPPSPDTGTILVVEDQEGIRRTVDRALKACGYTVLTASGGNEALSLVKAHPEPVDLLISDVLLWGMTGAELYGRVRQIHRKLRVLFMSGYTEEVLRQYGVSSATAPFLRKPFGPPVLVAKVREVLSLPAPTQPSR
jgi:two-component system cell cycle sensor histidine kinase/response regulator CckA